MKGMAPTSSAGAFRGPVLAAHAATAAGLWKTLSMATHEQGLPSAPLLSLDQVLCIQQAPHMLEQSQAHQLPQLLLALQP